VLQAKTASDTATTQKTSEPDATELAKEFPGITFYQIPFAYDLPQRRFLTIQATINGSKPMMFLLDTGFSTGCVLLPWAAKELGLKYTGKEGTLDRSKEKFRITEPFSLRPVTADGPGLNLDMAGAYVGNVLPLETFTKRKLAGIIGAGLFVTYTVRLDFDRNILTVILDSHNPLPVHDDGITIPMEEYGLDKTSPRMPYIKATPAGGKLTTFLIDTGSDSSEIAQEESGNLTVIDHYEVKKIDVAGFRKSENFLVSHLTLAGRNEPLVTIGVRPGRTYGLLGMDFLSRFRVTFDQRNGIMTLEPRSPVPQKRDGYPTFSFNERNGHRYVTFVNRQFPELQTVTVEDRMVSVDGKAADDMASGEILQAIAGFEGTTAKLTLEKPNGQSYTVSYLRPNAFPNIVTSPLGMTLFKEAGEFARIVFVDAGSEAEKAGFKKDQWLTQVNGKSTRGMERNTLLKELQTATAKTIEVKNTKLEIKSE
jgi:predicted aspartyl protease